MLPQHCGGLWGGLPMVTGEGRGSAWVRHLQVLSPSCDNAGNRLAHTSWYGQCHPSETTHSTASASWAPVCGSKATLPAPSRAAVAFPIQMPTDCLSNSFSQKLLFQSLTFPSRSPRGALAMSTLGHLGPLPHLLDDGLARSMPLPGVDRGWRTSEFQEHSDDPGLSQGATPPVSSTVSLEWQELRPLLTRGLSPAPVLPGQLHCRGLMPLYHSMSQAHGKAQKIRLQTSTPHSSLTLNDRPCWLPIFHFL